MKARITKRTVDATKPGKRDIFIWDADVKGFGLKVTPAGKRIYILQYRINGRLRRYTLGRHGSPWTPDEARTEAARLLGLIADGTDPSELRADATKDISVATLCDVYLAEGCATKRASTVVTDRRNIERHTKPLLGRRTIRSINRADVERFRQDIANGKTAVDVRTSARGRAIVAGGKGVATRTIATLGAMYSFAVERGLLRENPVRGIKPFKSAPRERFLSVKELSRLGDVLLTAERDGLNPYAIIGIRLLVMTGCRKSEILTLRWENVDFDRGFLRLPISKTGAKVVPLGAPVLEILASVPRVEGSPFVLPSFKGNGHLVGLQKIWEKIRKRAGLEDVRIHDLRHSFASVAVAGGDSLYLVGKVLGHRQSNSTERYAHLHDDPLRAVADRAANKIAAAMKGETEGGKVVDFKRGA
jgi:integrase